MKRGFCSFRQRVSLFLSTASRVHGPHSFQAQSHPKAHSSLCPQMQKPAGDHQKGKPSSRDVNQAEWPLAMARAPIWSRNTALPRSPSIVPYVTDPDFSIIGVLAKYRHAEGQSLHIWLAHGFTLEFLTSSKLSALIGNCMGNRRLFHYPELGPGICIYIYTYLSTLRNFCKLTIT